MNAFKKFFAWFKQRWESTCTVEISNHVTFKDGDKILYSGPLHEAPEWLKAEYRKAQKVLDEMKEEIEKHTCKK